MSKLEILQNLEMWELGILGISELGIWDVLDAETRLRVLKFDAELSSTRTQ